MNSPRCHLSTLQAVITLRFLAGMGVLLVALPASAQKSAETKRQEMAAVPYELLYGLVKLQQQMATNPNVAMVVQMRPKSPDVKQEDVRAFIDSKQGPIPLAFARDGSFDMRLSDALLKENPPVRSNQPRGTMSLDWGFAIKGVKGLEKSSTYSQLIAPMAESRDVLATMADHLPDLKSAQVTGMKLFFETKEPVRIIVHSKKAPRTFEADAQGICLVPYDALLVQEDPVVTMPAAPKKIDFVVQGSH